jgi:hypothetical protein
MVKTSYLNIEDFLNITKKEISYFLGFFWSDGFFDKKILKIEIKEEDGNDILDVLYKFGIWNISKRIRKDKYKQIKYTASNIDVYNFLIYFNFDKKSFVSPEKIYDYIPNELRKYFLRGLIDGDGCFSSSFKNKGKFINRSYFSLTGRIDFEWNFLLSIFDNLNINYKLTRLERITGSSSFIVISSQKDITLLYNYIYSDYDNIGLKRKYLICKEIVDRKLKINQYL